MRVGHPRDLHVQGFALLIGLDQWEPIFRGLGIEFAKGRTGSDDTSFDLYAPRWAVILTRLDRGDLLPRALEDADLRSSLSALAAPPFSQCIKTVETYLASLDGPE